MEVGREGLGLCKFRELEVQCTAGVFFASVFTSAGTVRCVQQLHFVCLWPRLHSSSFVRVRGHGSGDGPLLTDHGPDQISHCAAVGLAGT